MASYRKGSGRSFDLNTSLLAIKTELNDQLLAPEKKVFQNVIDRYVEKNNQFFANDLLFNSFRYMVKAYRASYFVGSFGIQHPSLHPELVRKFSEELKAHQKAEMSFNYIWQAILPLVSESFTVNDLPLKEDQLIKLSPVQLQNYRNIEEQLNYLLALKLIT